MNNLEALLADYDSDLFNALDCDCCVFHNSEKVCIYDFDMCERGTREWLLSEHVDANDALPPENDVSTDDVDANDENDALDSREKLEAEIDDWCAEHFNSSFSGKAFNLMLRWLNRQAAITSKEWCWTNDSLQEQVNMLTEQRDHYIELFHEHEHAVYELKRKLEAATDANTDYRDEWHRVCAERANLARDLGNAMAERDRYRELCSKLLDAADDMRRVRDAFDQFERGEA